MQGNLGLSDICLNKNGKGALGLQCYIPNFKHLSKVVLKMKIFKYFFLCFLLFQPRTPVVEPSLILRPWFEQSWYKTTWQRYISNFKRLTKVVLKKKFFFIFLCISMVRTLDSLAAAILDSGTFV